MDDFDFRSDEERAADDADELQRLEFVQLGNHLDDKQALLDKLAADDPVGVVWFGDRDDWVDSRLSRNTPEGPVA
jgi:hypothetical protein